MSHAIAVSPAGKATVVALITAAVGVATQIAAGAPYPTVPPVFFILLIPSGLIAMGRWWWAPILAVLAGMFLTIGLFAAGETGRLVHPTSVADSFGLWMQMVAVLAAKTNLRRRRSAIRD
jgi:hypothetical protein